MKSLVLPEEVIVKRFALALTGRRAARYGTECLVICGKHFIQSEDMEYLQSSLSMKQLFFVVEEYIGGEPDSDYIDSLVARYAGFDKEDGERYDRHTGEPLPPKVNCVIGIGGGSVLDVAKAVAGLLTNPGSVVEYMELPGKKDLKYEPVPFIAIPTTAGTGAEATPNAVIKINQKKFKKSIRDPKLVPNRVIIDSTLYVTASKEVTAHAGADALAQLIESFVGKKAKKETDNYCRQGFKHIQYLAAAVADGENLQAREETALAAFKSGVAIGNSSVGAIHALAAPIGAYTDLPHGYVCGVLLPHIMEINLEHNIKKFAEIGRLLTGNDGEDAEMAEKALAAVKNLLKSIGIPKTFKNKTIVKNAEKIAADSVGGAAMLGNPVQKDLAFWVDFLEKVGK